MKRGITVSMLIIVVAVMMIVVTTTSVVGVKSIARANYETFKGKVDKVSDLALEYISTNKIMPVTGDVIGRGTLGSDLIAEITENGDENNKLMVLDLSKLDTTVDIGTGTVNDGDVFVICENTNNVYYLKGMEYNGKIYHSNK